MKSLLTPFLFALFLLPGSPAQAFGADQPQQRVLRFPPDRSLGTLFTRPRDEGGFDTSGSHYPGWKRIGEAQGEVVIPETSDIRLNVSATGAKELSGLDSLPPDAIDAIRLKDTQLTDDGLKHVGRLTGLKFLDLQRTRITDAGIKHLANLKELRQVDLDGVDVAREGFGIADEGLSVLSKLPKLWRLTLTRTNVTDIGIINLRNMKSLRSLSLGGTKVTDRSLIVLRRLPRLDTLSLGFDGIRTNITDTGAEHLAELKSLRWLRIGGTEITDAGLKDIGQLPNLEFLSTRGIKITSEGLAHLSGLTLLKSIDGDRFNDQGAAHLEKLTSLERISGDLELTDAGAISLAQLSRLEKMSLDGDGGRITDACLPAITNMKSLNELRFSDCLITDEGLQHLTGLKSLSYVSLTRNEHMTAEGLKFLSTLPALERLSLSFSETAHWRDRDKWHLRHLRDLKQLKVLSLTCRGLTNDDLQQLSGLASLEHLTLHDSWHEQSRLIVNDEGMRHLAGLTSLKYLRFDETTVTDAGLQQLAGLSKLEYLTITGRFTDRGLEQFLKLKSLRNLQIASPDITEQAVERLRQRHPSVQRVNHFQYCKDGVEASYRPGDKILRKGAAEDREQFNALEGRQSPPLLVDRWLNLPEEKQSLEELQGNVVLIHFWHARSSRNRWDLPLIRKLLKLYKQRGLVVVGVHISRNEEEMEPAVKAGGIDWPVAIDVEKRTAELFHEPSMSTFYLIDRTGKLRFARPHPADIEEAVKLLLDEK